MLAVALLVSAISFARVGAGDNKTAFAAVTVEPPITELAIDASGWKWNVPFKKDADGNIAVFLTDLLHTLTTLLGSEEVIRVFQEGILLIHTRQLNRVLLLIEENVYLLITSCPTF